ncbi:unannotated protein [freshwater metagenome]|uniref:Unannotated protein n=1 Tax=freshwater metagenome TaxID=449393 RepID=A0A6J6ME37_9ZZZZ
MPPPTTEVLKEVAAAIPPALACPPSGPTE